MTDHGLFTTESAGLAQLSPSGGVRLADGDRWALSIGPVRKELGGDLRMLAYNGSIPGPTLHEPVR
jgi:hypothetical protein